MSDDSVNIELNVFDGRIMKEFLEVCFTETFDQTISDAAFREHVGAQVESIVFAMQSGVMSLPQDNEELNEFLKAVEQDEDD
jgi:hypothetical protein